ncbi:amidohydrolase [Enterococcus faecalis]
MTETLLKNLKAEIQQESEYIIALRRHFHQYPEASLQEFDTIKRIKQELDQLGISYEPVGATGVLGTIQGNGQPGKTLLLRADIDALELADETSTSYQSKHPGLNHACGHDGHAAALLGAAKILNNYQGAFAGTIKLAFQPAEEIGAGARQFVEGGYVKDVDQVFGLHLDSSVTLGQLVATKGATNASCDIFTLEIKGKSSHVAQPHQGRDAVLAAASIVVELQKIAAREVSPLEPVVVGIGVLQAGTRYNIVANHARIEGTVRAFSHETRAFVLQRLQDIATETAQAHRTELSLCEIYAAANPLINNVQATVRAQQVAAEIVGAENVVTDNPPSLGADDFADFLAVAPGVYGRVGTRNPENSMTHYGHHHEKFDIDEAALTLATEYHIRYALSYLNEK